jgi:orotate phosphoribosyltransferase
MMVAVTDETLAERNLADETLADKALADPKLARDVDSCCRLTGEFTLRSGQVASEYFDKYLFESDPVLLARVVEQMKALVPDGTELLGGLELGGVPIAAGLSARTGLPALFVRTKAKEYGTCKLAEGPPVAGRRVTPVEDVNTPGGAVRDATSALRGAGAIVEVVICAIDRSPAGENPLADVGLEVRPVLTKAQLDAARG